MSNSQITQSGAVPYHYRLNRRRWVPKGVALLALLFVVGLLTACQNSADPLVAAIAVPALHENSQEASHDTVIVPVCVNDEATAFVRVRANQMQAYHAISSDSIEAARQTGLNVF